MAYENGHGERLKEIQQDVSFLKANLADTVGELNKAVASLDQTLAYLADKIEAMIGVAQKSLPIHLVMLMFMTMLGVIFGVEIIKTYLGPIGK